MRRRHGTGLVKNELRLLLVACEIHANGSPRFHGYEVARHLAGQEGKSSAMNPPTLYRALRRLEERGALTSEWESPEEAAADGRDGKLRRYYRVTSAGLAAARQGLRELDVQWSDRYLRVLESGLES